MTMKRAVAKKVHGSWEREREREIQRALWQCNAGRLSAAHISLIWKMEQQEQPVSAGTRSVIETRLIQLSFSLMLYSLAAHTGHPDSHPLWADQLKPSLVHERKRRSVWTSTLIRTMSKSAPPELRPLWQLDKAVTKIHRVWNNMYIPGPLSSGYNRWH